MGPFAYAQGWDSVERAVELGAIVSATLLRKGARGSIDGIPRCPGVNGLATT